MADSNNYDEVNAQRLQTARETFRNVAAKFPSVPACPTEELVSAASQAAISKGELVLVDVRKDEEIAVSTIPGAISVSEFEALNVDAHTPVVAFCTMGFRSGTFAKSLQDRGFTDVRNGEGVVIYTHFAGAAPALGLVKRDRDTHTLTHTHEVHTGAAKSELIAAPLYTAFSF